MSCRDEARYEPGDSTGTVRNDDCAAAHHGALNINTDFQVRQHVSLANAVLDQDMLPDENSFRQQFNSLSKDFLSKEQLHTDQLNGSFFQSMKDGGSTQFRDCHALE